LIKGETKNVRRCLAIGKLTGVHRCHQLKVDLAHVVKRPPDRIAHGVFVHPFEIELLA
jgi:hypothetical protein